MNITNNQPTLYVIVLGESESKDYVQGYANVFNHTPFRSKINKLPHWIQFNNAYSPYTHTDLVFKNIFTSNRVLTGMSFPNCSNMFSVFKHAKMPTIWMSKQPKIDRYLSSVYKILEYSTQCTHIYKRNNQNSDLDLFPYFENFIDSFTFNQSTLFFLHLYGSHYSYNLHNLFPYIDYCQKYFLGKVALDEQWCSEFSRYMILIQETDQLLEILWNKLITLMNRPIFFMYFADHGETFEGYHGHNWWQFHWTMSRISLYMWTSEEYERVNPQIVQTLKEHRDSYFTNDLFYDTILGITGVKNQFYDPRFDLSSPFYILNASNGRIMNNMTLDEDSFNHAMSNIQQNLFVYVDEIQCVYTLRRIKSFNAKRIKINVLFSSANQFEIHSEPYLKYLLAESSDLYLILNISVCENPNYSEFYKLLDEMEKNFKLKNRTTLMSNDSTIIFRYGKLGWFVCYVGQRQNVFNQLPIFLDSSNVNVSQIQRRDYLHVAKSNILNPHLDLKIRPYLNYTSNIIVDFETHFK